jgi:hypothetical protein
MNVLDRRSRAISLMLVASTMGACSAEAPSGPSTASIDTAQSDLQLGSTGEAVRTLNAYLTKYGYFPNGELARKYPQWRPLVADPPTRQDVFDEHSAEAVRQLQAHLGLTVTGVVDATTWENLKAERCGVPEGISEFDSADKFALGGTKWNKTTITWKFTNSTNSSYRAAAAAAFDQRNVGHCRHSADFRPDRWPVQRPRASVSTGQRWRHRDRFGGILVDSKSNPVRIDRSADGAGPRNRSLARSQALEHQWRDLVPQL